MGLFPVKQCHVEIGPQRVAESPTEFLHEDDIEVPHERGGGRHGVNQVRPAAQVDHDAGERLVHRKKEKAIPPDPQLIAKGLFKCLSQNKTHILNGVVIIHVHVSLRLDGEVVQAVLGKQGQHVVKERHTGVDLGRTPPVDVEGQGNIRLRRLPRDGRYAF